MSSPMVLRGPAAVQEAECRHLGSTDWLDMTQERLDRLIETLVTIEGAGGDKPACVLRSPARRCT